MASEWGCLQIKLWSGSASIPFPDRTATPQHPRVPRQICTDSCEFYLFFHHRGSISRVAMDLLQLLSAWSQSSG